MGDTSILLLVSALAHPPAMRRLGNTRVWVPSLSMTASSKSRPTGAAEAGLHSRSPSVARSVAALARFMVGPVTSIKEKVLRPFGERHTCCPRPSGNHQYPTLRPPNLFKIDHFQTSSMQIFRQLCKTGLALAALGQKQTPAPQKRREKACPLCPRKRTCPVQSGISAEGHKRTFALQ